ncbi:unnamed protein product [Thlaspi arvense]|uniref:KIB1-4 beta-propeller domain-containing protein n=1 Tax=Thlaspi arvense TaxID=13288 RepID=A0AAU9SRT0_THLAR|nr:unnamed protein product [Thlaspi arvense]
MSLLSRLSKLRLGKPALVRRSSLLLLSNGFSSSFRQTPPCWIYCGKSCGDDLEKLLIHNFDGTDSTVSEKKVPREMVSHLERITIGASHGWVATLKDDGILRLHDDLNPYASDTDAKRIPLPPLATLPHCQTKIVTNVSMSSSSPEDEDCVVAVKFLGPQISFCRPANKPEWRNIRIENPCFYSSRVMFSKKHDTFRILGSGGYIIGSWDLSTKRNKPKFQRLRFQNLPELTKTKRDLLHSCCTSDHLVESTSTGETFLVKFYRRATSSGVVYMKTRAVMVFRLDDEGNAVYTQDIGDLCIFISMSEPFCVPASSFPGMSYNCVKLIDSDEYGSITPDRIISKSFGWACPYYIPPQNID